MTDATFSTLADAQAVASRDYPDAVPCPGLSELLGDTVAYDPASGAILWISDFSGSDPHTGSGDDISLTVLSGTDWMHDYDLADVLADRARVVGSSSEATASFRTALEELARAHAAALAAADRDAGSQSVAFELFREESELRQRADAARAVRAHLIRGMAAEVDDLSPDMDQVALMMRLPVQDFDELATLVNEHRRMMGEHT